MDDKNITSEDLFLAEKIADLFKVSDENIFSVLERKSLSLSGYQIKILLYLKTFNNPYLNNFIEEYLKLKTFNKSWKVLLEALKYYSLIDLIRSKVRLNLNTSNK